MPRANINISLPAEMAREVDKARKREHRTRSELVREALRAYLGVGRSYPPTPAELRAIEEGRAAHRRGESMTLSEARAYVDRLNRKARPQKRRARASA